MSDTPAPVAPLETGWDKRIAAFATAVNKQPADITTALIPLVGDAGDSALSVLSDPTAVTDDDLRGVLVNEGPKIPLGVFRKNLVVLRGPAPLPTSVSGDGVSGASFDILPSIPDDTSFIASLKVGGEPKVDGTTVISAVKAAIASRIGLFEIPGQILVKMEAHAESLDEPVAASYFELRKLVATRSYAEVLSALGVEGTFMSEAKKTSFLGKLDTGLWVALQGFHEQLVGWQQAWMAGAANPAAMMSLMMMGQAGHGGAMPPGMLQPPETASLHDSAESVVNSVNRVFAGVGIPVARALAYDATRIKGVLDNPNLPAAVGAMNKEQMLKLLGVAVAADLVRLERNIARYALAVIEFGKVTVPNEELAYLAAMFQLGATIPWEKLLSGEFAPGGGAGIGGGRPRRPL
jgi:hypothetical protein